MKIFLSIAAIACIAAPCAMAAQSAADGPILGATRFSATGSIKLYNAAGSVRIVGWDRDSVLVRGRIPRNAEFLFPKPRFKEPTPDGMKLGIMDLDGKTSGARADFVIYMPKRATVSARTGMSDIEATNVGGWFYSSAGTIRLSGSAASADVESINGSLDINLSTAWVRARSGDGHVLVRGTPQDVDASTISGTLDIATNSIMRGQLASVSGDIHYAGLPLPESIFDFSNHGGAIDLMLARDVSGVFTLSTVTGAIQNGMSAMRPAAAAPHSLRLELGRAATSGAQVSVRTFKGTIRLRPE